jgi:hypothetical protein
MTDSSYATKTYRKAGGDDFVIASGGTLTIEDGGAAVIGDTTLTVDGSGHVVVTGIPTADPHVVGALYSNSGILTLSAG